MMDSDELQRIADYAGGAAANLAAEVDRLQTALALAHDWAALGGEHGEQPDERIMLLARQTLDDAGFRPESMA